MNAVQILMKSKYDGVTISPIGRDGLHVTCNDNRAKLKWLPKILQRKKEISLVLTCCVPMKSGECGDDFESFIVRLDPSQKTDNEKKLGINNSSKYPF
jgi:hypothetical protein